MRILGLNGTKPGTLVPEADLSWADAIDLGNTAGTTLAVGSAYTASTSGGSKAHNLPSLSGLADGDAIFFWVDADSVNNVQLVCDGADLIFQASATTTTNRFIGRTNGPCSIVHFKGYWWILQGHLL